MAPESPPTPDLTPDPAPRSRRSLLAAALGGVAGLVAGRLGSPERAAAAAGSPVILGSQ